MRKKLHGLSNRTVLIDKGDYSLVGSKKWYFVVGRYAGDKKGILMHRLILNAEKGQQVDHINGNGLDNRRNNLRFVTQSQNMMNAKKRRNTTSKYKGVSWNKHHKKWKAEINYKKTNLIGYFDVEKDAAMAYNRVAKKVYGVYGRPNNLKEKT